MVGAIVISLTDEAMRQEAGAGPAQRVVVARAQALVTQPYSIVSSTSALRIRILSSRSARSAVQFEDAFPEAAPCVAYSPIDLDGKINIHCG